MWTSIRTTALLTLVGVLQVTLMQDAAARQVVNERGYTCMLDATGNLVACRNPNKPRNDDIFFQELPNTAPSRECQEAFEELEAADKALTNTLRIQTNEERLQELNDEKATASEKVRRFCN